MKNRAILLLLQMFGWVPLAFGRLLGRFIGRVIYWLNQTPVLVSRINLQLCYPQLSVSEIEALVKKRMLHLGQAFVEMPRVWSKPSTWLERKIVAVEGEELFEAAMQNPRGTILIVPHLGNWEVIGLWVSPRSKMTSTTNRPKFPK